MSSTASGRRAASEPGDLARRARRQRRRRVVRYAAIRLSFIPPGLFLIISLAFLITKLTPSDPVRTILGPVASTAEIEALSHHLGLDVPLWQQYLIYLAALAHGDLGTSYYSQTSVAHELFRRLPASLEIIVIGLFFGLLAGVAIGGLGAYYRGRWVDRATKGMVSFGQAVPEFLIGLLLAFFLYFVWQVLPAPQGQINFSDTAPARLTGATLIDALLAGNFETAVSAAQHLVLPVLTITIGSSVIFAKITRATQAEALDAAHTEFARACGLRERTVFMNALRTGLAPLFTYVAIIVAGAVGGVAIVETLFSWPGAGAWAVDVMLKRDLPAVQGFILVAASITFVTYIISDIAVRFMDPRVADST